MNHQPLLAAYLRGANIFTEQIKLLPDEVIDFRPDLPEAWTIREHIAHLAECETEGFIRLNPAITQAILHAGPLDSAEAPDDAELEDEAKDINLATLMTVRELIFDYLSDNAPEKWNAKYTLSIGPGQTLQLGAAEILQAFATHLNTHSDFVERNIAAFNQSAEAD